jgi:hypothetical protein
LLSPQQPTYPAPLLSSSLYVENPTNITNFLDAYDSW